MRGKFDLRQKFTDVGVENCFISEITLAELKFGVENSPNPERNQETLNNFLSGIKVLPVFHALDLYAKEKARLRKLGTPVDDFDLLIGATAIAHEMILITNNVGHFSRLQNIMIEDWRQLR